MDFSKLKNKLLVCLCCVVLILPFYLITFTYASEDVSYDTVSGITIISNRNYFSSGGEGSSVGYIELEKGYIYTVHTTVGNLQLAVSNNVPELNGSYTYLGAIGNSQEFNDYSFVADNNTTYLYLGFSWASSNTTVTREKIPGMDSAVGDLVNNVGIDNIWNIFDISVNYIVVVVLVAFGIFIITRIIKKISKGKEGL